MKDRVERARANEPDLFSKKSQENKSLNRAIRARRAGCVRGAPLSPRVCGFVRLLRICYCVFPRQPPRLPRARPDRQSTSGVVRRRRTWQKTRAKTKSSIRATSEARFLYGPREAIQSPPYEGVVKGSTPASRSKTVMAARARAHFGPDC